VRENYLLHCYPPPWIIPIKGKNPPSIQFETALTLRSNWNPLFGSDVNHLNYPDFVSGSQYLSIGQGRDFTVNNSGFECDNQACIGEAWLDPARTANNTSWNDDFDLTEDFVLDHTHQVQAGNLDVEHDVNSIYSRASFQYPRQFGVG